MPNVTVGSFSLGAGPLISGDCLGWLLIIRLLSHRPQSEATPRADPAKPAMNESHINKKSLGIIQFSLVTYVKLHLLQGDT